MSEQKINITSSLFEKGFDSVKSFLGKLIGPAFEEIGLLIQDPIRMWRFRNQVRILKKAEKICNRNNIAPKDIPIKMLVPLLDTASLEDQEEMQDIWATLLSNLVDSDQNLKNHVFPHILGQISFKEFSALRNSCKLRSEQTPITKAALKDRIQTNQPQIEELEKQLNDYFSGDFPSPPGLHQKLFRLKQEIKRLEEALVSAIGIEPGVLAEHEVANLVRLGVLKITPFYFAGDEWKILNKEVLPLDVEGSFVNVETVAEVVEMTKLGELFVQVCTEKRDHLSIAIG